MSCWAWSEITNSTAAAAMFANLSNRLSKLVCGFSPPTTAEDRYKAGLRALLLLPSSPETQPRRSPSPSASPPEDDDDSDETAAMSPAEPCMEHYHENDMASTLPCLAFASEHGYRIFSLAEMRMLAGDEVPPMSPVLGRRLIPSPYGETVLATDVCYKHPCHLINPFTGERSALPDLPVPFSEKEPVRFHPDDSPPRPGGGRVTDDGLAWDWSPRGVMVARGDTAFFFSAHGEGDDGEEWTPVHQAARGSPMTVNYRGGRFFLLELRSLLTTVVDAATLRAVAEIPPPGSLRGGVYAAYLAPSDDDGEVLLLVHRAGDTRGVLFTEAFHARVGSRSSPRWSRVRDIGDRVVFVDGAHAFTVAADTAAGAMAMANRVYVIIANRVERPCGGLAVVYDMAYSDLARPEHARRLKIDVDEVEPMWGHPHWIIRSGRDESGRHA